VKAAIYEHFHADEKPFVDRVTEWIERSARQHELKRTDFLDPRQAQILLSLANRSGDVAVRLDGGYSDAERRRAIIAPDYRDIESEALDLSVLEVRLPAKTELDHGDFLGALLGLGVKRDRIGDIHVHESFAHIVVLDEIAQFLNVHLRQVHRDHVLTEILPIDQLKPARQQLEELNITVASMRLDGITSDVYRLSRTKIVDPIRAGRCKVNWRTIEDPSAVLREGDVVSFKGFGRFKVIEVDGVTKKGRTRVKVGKYV